MKYCPYYKNKDVFDGFNKIITSLGGRPMTEEEFRSSPLRNQREGLDYSAMEIAYRVYDRNGGNLLDLTPDGKPSLLYQTLLDYYHGDEASAIVAKSNVYSDEFFNWFGDWTGNTNSEQFDEETKKQISLIFKRIPKLSEIGTEEQYAKYIQTIFPESKDKSIYWHGSNSDFSEGFKSAKRGEGSGAPETKKRNDFYLAKLAWAVLQYVNGVNRKSVDKNGFSHWNKLWWEFKEIMSNGRRLNNDWKDLVINEENVRQAIPNKKGIFNRDEGGNNGKWLKERKADYGYENKSDKEFFEEILGVKWGEDTFNTWTKRNEEIFKSLQETEKGIYPAVINTQNPIRESGQNTYYEEDRGLFTQADANNNDAILSSNADNEFNSDIAVVLRDNERVHFLGTEDDIKSFKLFVDGQLVSKVVDTNGEPLVVWHGSKKQFEEFKKDHAKSPQENPLFNIDPELDKAFFFSSSKEYAEIRGDTFPVYLNIKIPFSKETIKLLSKKHPDIFDDDEIENLIYDFYDDMHGNLDKFQLHTDEVAKAFSLVREFGNDDVDGVIGIDVMERDHENDFAVRQPNQIKHIENLGTWNPNNPNIYYLAAKPLYDVQSIPQEDVSYFTQTSLIDSFGQELSDRLMNGETVSSRDLMNYMIDNMIYHPSNIKLAKALSHHDVPVRIGYTMKNGEFAKILTEDGGSVIYINPNELSLVSRGYAGTTIMHELVHAVTVDIIDNPKTEEDKAFVESNRMMYKRLSKGIKHLNVHTINALTSMYAFENEKEFAAVFASDPEARLFIYEYAERLDRINRTNKFTNALKNLINRLVKAFGKRAIFDVTNKTTVQQLLEYETTLRSFLQDASIIERGNIPSKSVLHKVYNQIDARVQNHEDFIEDMKELERIGTALKNYLLGIRRVKRNNGNIQVSSFEDVIRALKTRISAIKGSTYDEVTRGKLLSQTLTQIDMFLLEEGGKYIAINHLLKSAVPLLLEDLDELRKIKKDGNTFSNSDYMYQMHANAGMYGSIFKQIATWLQSDENVEGMLEFYNKTLKEGDEPLTKEDVDTLFVLVQNAQTFADLIVGNLEYMLRENGIEKLRDLAEKAGSQDMESYINALNSKDADKLIEDIGMWESLATPSDSSSNEAIRALSFMINNALDKAQMDSFDKSVDLQILQKGLKRGEKAWLCYEVDENGRFTGYLVRDLNFGRFKRDYDNEIIRINKILADKFGLTTLNVNHNRVAPEGEDGQRVAVVTVTENGRDVTKEMTAKEFFDYSKEMWLIDHCERKYTAEYYKKYAMLPQSIKTQLLAIKTQISAITSNYDNLYDDKNIPHYEVLSDEDWIKLNQLWERRRFLSKDVDEFGHQKEGTELEAARLLRQLYEELYHINDDDKKNKERPKDIKGWKAARNEIIRQFGEDSEQLKKWDERNSKKVFKQNEFGEVIVFKLIEDEFGDSKIFYSDKYEELKEAKKLLLSNFRMLNGEYDADSINTTLENAIHTIDEEMFKERMKIRYGDETFASRAAAYSEIFKRHIKFVESTLLQRARKNAEVEALRIAAEEEEIDPFTARSVLEIVDQMLSEKYGEIKYDDDLFLLGADDGVFNPYSYYTRMESVDPDLMEVIPNDGWAIDKEDNNNLNDKFDEKYGEAWVPKRSIYDNTEAFNKFNENSSEFSESLRAMYDGLYNTIKEANELMQLEYQDNYMLPQVECTSLERLGRKGTLKSIARMFGWGRFYGRVEDPNDQERGQDYKEIANTADNGTEELARTYPDGRDYHSIPRYFTKKLEHPELISKNAVGIVWDYYRNARRYSERSKIKDDCEMIADLIKRQQFKKDKRAVGGKEGEESNTYQYVRNLIERDLYDIRRVKLLSNVTIDYTKIARLIQRLTTAINLGMSPKVAMVGFFTTMYTHIMNGITGYKYSFWDMFKSLGIVLKEFGLSLFGAKFLGNRLTKNKIIKLLELADLADQGSRKLEHSNRIPKIVQFIYKNSTFGLMTAADVIAKSTITVATLLSYRLVDGKFMTRHEIEESRVALGEEEYKRLMSEFEKSNVNAYNAILDDTSVKEKLKHPFTNTGDTKVKINPEYETAWNEIRDRALTTAIKNAEDADGIATRMQKAMMTRNAIGAFVLIHRQYIPLMLSKMFGKRVYDYDTHEYKNGQFRTMFLYISQLACSSTLAATVGGGFAGVAFGGFAPITLMVGGGSAAAYSIYKKVQNKRRGIKRKTIRLVNEEFLGGGLKSIFTGTSKNIYTNDSKTYANQVQNRYQLKQTIMEVLLYNLVTLPCVNALCMAADSTDKDDDYWKWIILQTLAYWARATQFESNTKYNMLDLASAIKTGTAAFNTIDSYSNLLGGIGKGLGIAGQNLLFGHNMQAETISANIYQLFVQNTDPENEDEDGFEIDDDFYGKSGAYKGYSKLFKSIMKATPAKNMWEQLRDPASKRRYQENLIMRMDKDEKRRLLYFDLFFNDDEEE